MAAIQDNSNSLSFEGSEATFGLQAWRYSLFLACSLLLWVLYLVLPKGVRKEYFGAYPKRYSKSTGAAKKQGIGQWIHPISTVGSVFSNSEQTSSIFSESVTEKTLADLAQARRAQLAALRNSREESSVRDDLSLGHSPEGWSRAESRSRIQSPFMNSIASSSVKQNSNSNSNTKDRYDVGAAASVVSGWTGAVSWTSSWRSKTPQNESGGGGGGGTSVLHRIEERSVKAPPSPKHPSILRVPDSTVILETMTRLKDRGIRLIAHGVQCEPKRVWIQLDPETMNLSWQTEFPRRVTSVNGQPSIVLMRGSIHKIALPNVLYIDVGKRTNALQRGDSTAIPDTVCFSLLTQNGSLDLQANSMLERDTLVSCFSVILDQVHQDQDWRALYEDSSSVVTGSEFLTSDMVEI